MRWKNKPEHEEVKLIEKKFFAFIPVSTENETRWLEYVTVQGYYIKGNFRWYWTPFKFID